jgi:hypothetical protein
MYRYRYDVLMVGASLAAAVAANRLAAAGYSVLVTDRRIYPGGEPLSANRLWLSDCEHQAVSALLGACVREVGEGTHCSHVLSPGLLKIALKDLILNAGGQLIYHLRPVSWSLGAEEQGHMVTFAGKNGCAQIVASHVIDATKDGVVAQLSQGCRIRDTGPSVPVSIVVELMGFVAPEDGLPKPIQMEDTTVTFRHGGFSPDHLLAECRFQGQFSVPEQNLPTTFVSVRSRASDLAKSIRQRVPALAKARVAGIAREAWMPPQRRIESSDHSRFRSKDGLWLLSGAMDVDDEAATEWHENSDFQIRLAKTVADAIAFAEPVSIHSFKHELPKRFLKPQVLVVGGGTSGAAAAIAAAESGCETLLVEMNAILGGTSTAGGINSHWLGRPLGFNQRVLGRIEEFDERPYSPFAGKQWNIESRVSALFSLIQVSGVTPYINTCPVSVLAEAGRLKSVICAGIDQLYEIQPQVTVDATGDGDIAVAAGLSFVYGSGRECSTMWYAYLPYTRPGTLKSNFHSMVYVGDPVDYTRAVMTSRRRTPGHDHSAYLAPRETRHIPGLETLSLNDQLLLRKRPDVVNLCFGNYDVKGHSCSSWVQFGVIPPQALTEVPYGAALPRFVDGLIVTGKAISAPNVSLPSWRMQADVENLGYGSGVAAAMAVENRCDPKEIDVRELQRRLVSHEILPQEVLKRAIESVEPLKDSALKAMVEELDDAVSLYDYQDQEQFEVLNRVIPFVNVCTSGVQIIPWLEIEVKNPGSPRKRLAAKALAWYGSDAGSGILIEEIETALNHKELPGLDERVRHVTDPPDQGAMAEYATYIHTLARTRDPRGADILAKVVERLDVSEASLKSKQRATFYTISALCDLAERSGDSRCVRPLSYLLHQSVFSGVVVHTGFEIDVLAERRAFAALLISRALARCGAREGYERLIEFTQDVRRPFSQHATNELSLLCGTPYGIPCDWHSHLSLDTPLSPQPWNDSDDPAWVLLPNI